MRAKQKLSAKFTNEAIYGPYYPLPFESPEGRRERRGERGRKVEGGEDNCGEDVNLSLSMSKMDQHLSIFMQIARSRVNY